MNGSVLLAALLFSLCRCLTRFIYSSLIRGVFRELCQMREVDLVQMRSAHRANRLFILGQSLPQLVRQNGGLRGDERLVQGFRMDGGVAGIFSQSKKFFLPFFQFRL